MIRMHFLALCMVLCAPAWAGLYDRDRPDDEALLEDVMSTLAGRFDRPPEGFWQARHDRALREINRLPNPPETEHNDLAEGALPLFDDAAVALYRLGRYAEAIIMLDRKGIYVEHLRVQGFVAGHQHRHRTLATRAACLIARYRADGAAADAQDLIHAKALLERLAELDRYNVDARLLMLDVNWLMTPPAFDPDSDDLFPNLLGLTRADLRGNREPAALAALELGGVLPWLLRRVRYGDGWRSVDVTYALSLALWVAGYDEEAVTAWIRTAELIDSGASTEVRNAPATGVVSRRMARHLGAVEDLELHQRLFQEIRERNRAWHAERVEWINAGLAQGRHPDTDPHFWAGFGEAPPPKPGAEPDRPYGEPVFFSTALVVGGMTALAVLFFVLGALALFISRRHPKAPTVDEV